VVDNDSSGFEHVFVGEERAGKIMGLHNWVQYYIEEKKGNINYLGWKGKQVSLVPKDKWVTFHRTTARRVSNGARAAVKAPILT